MKIFRFLLFIVIFLCFQTCFAWDIRSVNVAKHQISRIELICKNTKTKETKRIVLNGTESNSIVRAKIGNGEWEITTIIYFKDGKKESSTKKYHF